MNTYSSVTTLAQKLIEAGDTEHIDVVIKLYNYLVHGKDRGSLIPHSLAELKASYEDNKFFDVLKEMFSAADDMKRTGNVAARELLDNVKLLADALNPFARSDDCKLLMLGKIKLISDPAVQYRFLRWMVGREKDTTIHIMSMLAAHPMHSIYDLVSLMRKVGDLETKIQLRDEIVAMATQQIADEMQKNLSDTKTIEDISQMAIKAAQDIVAELKYRKKVGQAVSDDMEKAAADFLNQTMEQFDIKNILDVNVTVWAEYKKRSAEFSETEALRKRIQELEAEKAALEQVNKAQAAEIDGLKRTNKDLDSRNTSLEETVKIQNDELNEAKKTIREMFNDIKIIAFKAGQITSGLLSKNVKNMRDEILKVSKKYNDRSM